MTRAILNRPNLVTFSLYLLLVSLLNFPLVLNLNSHVIGRSFEDAFEVLWQLSWMDVAIFEEGVNPFYAPDIFYPHGWYTASGAQPSWYLLMLAPVTHGLGATTTYNLALLGTLVLAAFGTYLLTSHFTSIRAGAFLAGVAYITAPTLTLRLGGHLHTLIAAACLPFATLCLVKTLTSEAGHWKWIFLTGVALALTILGHWYFLFIGTVPLAGIFFLTPSPLSTRQRLFAGAVIAALTLSLVAPFAYLTQNARAQMFSGAADFSPDQADALGLSLDYLLAGNPNHPLWDGLLDDYFPLRGEQDVVAIGFVVLILALVGIFTRPWQQTRPLLAMALIALVLALGLTLYWRGARVQLAVGPLLEQLYARIAANGPTLPAGEIAIPLPALLLSRFVPFMTSLRVWARFLIPFMLVAAVFSGLGLSYLRQRGNLGRAIALLLGILVIFEGLIIPYENFTPVSKNQRQVDLWLAQSGREATLVEYPLPFVNKNALYSQAQHGRSIVNGYMSLLPDFYQAASDQLGTWPDEESVALLREWEVDYMLLSSRSDLVELQERILPALEALPGVCLVEVFNDGFMEMEATYLFEIQAADSSCES